MTVEPVLDPLESWLQQVTVAVARHLEKSEPLPGDTSVFPLIASSEQRRALLVRLGQRFPDLRAEVKLPSMTGQVGTLVMKRK